MGCHLGCKGSPKETRQTANTPKETRQRRHAKKDTPKQTPTRQRRHAKRDTPKKTRQRRHAKEDTPKETRQKRSDLLRQCFRFPRATPGATFTATADNDARGDCCCGPENPTQNSRRCRARSNDAAVLLPASAQPVNWPLHAPGRRRKPHCARRRAGSPR